MTTDRPNSAPFCEPTGASETTTAEPARRLVYVAGPYTHPDPVTNTRAAVAAAEAIHARGDVPVVPHLSMLWHLISPHDIDWWYAYDLDLLRRCDRLVRLPGASTGADREVDVALELGLPVEIWGTPSERGLGR